MRKGETIPGTRREHPERRELPTTGDVRVRSAAMRAWRAVALALLALLVGTAGPVSGDAGETRADRAANTLGPVEIEQAFPGLSLPPMLHLTHAGDGTNRLWAVLQTGLVMVMVFPNDEDVSSAGVFIDLQDRVQYDGGEQGLLGLAFDPDYENNGLFFVNYTASGPRTVVSRFSVSAANPNQADPDSELTILEVSQPFANHNGGTLAFGPEGYLYIGLGDGGSAGDPLGNGQSTTTFLGSILRIDVSASSAAKPYLVPPDKPFVGGSEGALEEIWAYGLRNPWKFSFDPATGQLWAGDVGQGLYEEIDLIAPGGNYGWNIMEGLHCFPPGTESCEQTGLELPVFEYGHDQGCSITGGYVYRGSRVPALFGSYVYGDFCSGRIWALRHDGTTVTEQALLADTVLNIPSFGVDENGELYIVAYDGRIYRFATALQPTPVAGLADWGLIALAGLLALALPRTRSRAGANDSAALLG